VVVVVDVVCGCVVVVVASAEGVLGDMTI
jgi:hypothetical protein